MEDYRLLVSVIDGTNDLVMSVLSDRSFEFVNRAWLDTLEYEEPEVDRLHLIDIVSPDSIQAFDNVISDVLAGNLRSGFELTLHAKTGKRVDVEGNLFPRKEGQKMVAATGFFRDVTERNAIRKELMKAESFARFITDLMIHDLTNVNQELLSLLELLQYDSALSEDLASLVQGGLSEIEKASGIITNVKRLFGMHQESPEPQDWDLDRVVKMAVSKVNLKFEKKRVRLKTNFSAGQYTLRADAYLFDAFYSLLYNAVQANMHNEVQIEIDAESLYDPPFLQINIIDHGQGIPDVQKEKLFVKAHQSESPETGIGLSMVKILVESYGGSLRVEDTVPGDYSQGTTIVLLFREYRDVAGNPEVC